MAHRHWWGSHALPRLPRRAEAACKSLRCTCSIISMLQFHGCTKDYRKTLSRKRCCCFSYITSQPVWEKHHLQLSTFRDVFSKRPGATSAATSLGDRWAVVFATGVFSHFQHPRKPRHLLDQGPVSQWEETLLVLCSPGPLLQLCWNISELSQVRRMYIFPASPVI